MRATRHFITARLIEVDTSRGKFVRTFRISPVHAAHRSDSPDRPGQALVARTGADAGHPIVRPTRTNGSVLDAAQTVAAGALEALTLGPRGAILLWSDETTRALARRAATDRRLRPRAAVVT
ncbi:MAG TPA: hypothetical protein VFN40_02050 [Gemmatimonadales bacterium]|nr:hypothetical protein [Gemmatimonadales bacterium]